MAGKVQENHITRKIKNILSQTEDTVMLYQISNGTVSVGGELILSHIDFEIRGNEKIAVVGKNGAGKTTLLKLVDRKSVV